MSKDPFESPKLLLSRGQENFIEFEDRFKAFAKSATWILVVEPDPHLGDTVIKAKLDKTFPPILRVVASDAANNFRHALDQAVNSAAVEIRGGKRDCYFPIAKDLDDLCTIYDQRRYKKIPLEIRSIINSFKPYPEGNKLLWSLGKLSGPNKHQIVLETATDVNLIVEVKVKTRGDGRRVYHWDSSREEMIIARASPGTVFNMHIEMPILVKFGGGGPLSGGDAPWTLKNLYGMALGIVSIIEAQTARIVRERNFPN